MMKKVLYILIFFFSFLTILFIQYYLRGNVDNIFTQSSPSFFSTIGLYYILLIYYDHKKSLWLTLVINVFHELQRYLFDGIAIDINDLFAIIIAVVILFLSTTKQIIFENEKNV